MSCRSSTTVFRLRLCRIDGELQGEQNIQTYDIDCWTFDVSPPKNVFGVFGAMAMSGGTNHGRDDFDDGMVKYFNKSERKHEKDIHRNGLAAVYLYCCIDIHMSLSWANFEYYASRCSSRRKQPSSVSSTHRSTNWLRGCRSCTFLAVFRTPCWSKRRKEREDIEKPFFQDEAVALGLWSREASRNCLTGEETDVASPLLSNSHFLC